MAARLACLLWKSFGGAKVAPSPRLRTAEPPVRSIGCRRANRRPSDQCAPGRSSSSHKESEGEKDGHGVREASVPLSNGAAAAGFPLPRCSWLRPLEPALLLCSRQGPLRRASLNGLRAFPLLVRFITQRRKRTLCVDPNYPARIQRVPFLTSLAAASPR